MAELTHKERLQPSLLDRLTDHEPGNTQETREQRVFSLQRLRESVLRDLGWLLNTTNLASSEDLGAHPEVARSVLNFGIPDLSGRPLVGTDVAILERRLRQAIADFEPRIIGPSLKVTLLLNQGQMNRNALTFLIEGDLWAQPLPLHLYLKTEIDPELGDVKITPYSG